MKNLIYYLIYRRKNSREIFKPIKGYKGIYEISNFGRIKKLKYGYRKPDNIINPGVDKRGYVLVVLIVNKKRKTVYLHHLVWDTFGNKKRSGKILQIDHIDGDRSNNKISNLHLVTQRENVSKGYVQNGNKTSRYTGVSWSKQMGKWRAQIYMNGKNECLGHFKSERKAYLVYQKMLNKINEGGICE